MSTLYRSFNGEARSELPETESQAFICSESASAFEMGMCRSEVGGPSRSRTRDAIDLKS